MLIIQSETQFNKDFEKIFSAVKKYFRVRKLDVFVSFATEKQIQKINFQTRNVDKSTDVLSFQNLDIIEGDFSRIKRKENKNPETDCLILGEIVICESIAKKQAKVYGHSLQREMCFLFLHGLLHLLGFDHFNEDEETRMKNMQKIILNDRI